MDNIIMSYAKYATLLLLVIVAVTASQQDDTSDLGNVINRAVEFLNDCGDQDLTTCVKERTVKFLDTVTGNVEITEGVTLKETKPNAESESDNPSTQTLSENARSSESSIDNLLTNRVAKFLGSHTLEFKIPKNTVEEMKRSLDSEEGRKKKKKILLPLLLLLKLKAAVILPLIFGAIALIAFKALVIGKVALVISVLIAVKKLLESKHASQSYEVVAHPHHTHSHITSYADDHHHGHFRRALDESTHPYSAYINNQQPYGNE